MNRRDFIKGLTGLAVNLTMLPVANAALKLSDVSKANIVETHLAFGNLEPRYITDSIVIHHIGNTNTDVSAAEVHNWHLGNGWSGIGYHYLIRKNGSIERGRPRDAVGAHALGQNKHALGINIVGNFERAYPTTEQLNSASLLIAMLCKLYDLSPLHSVYGHRDMCDTLCPGRHLYGELPVLAKNAAGILSSLNIPLTETKSAPRNRHRNTDDKKKSERHTVLYRR